MLSEVIAKPLTTFFIWYFLEALLFPFVLDAHFQLAFPPHWVCSRPVCEHRLRRRLVFSTQVGGDVSVAIPPGCLAGSLGVECLY